MPNHTWAWDMRRGFYLLPDQVVPPAAGAPAPAAAGAPAVVAPGVAYVPPAVGPDGAPAARAGRPPVGADGRPGADNGTGSNGAPDAARAPDASAPSGPVAPAGAPDQARDARPQAGAGAGGLPARDAAVPPGTDASLVRPDHVPPDRSIFSPAGDSGLPPIVPPSPLAPQSPIVAHARSPAPLVPDDGPHDALHMDDAAVGFGDHGGHREMVDMGQQTTPEKQKMVVRPKTTRKGEKRKACPMLEFDRMRGPVHLIEVPVDAVSCATPSRIPGREVRHRIRTLEYWRGEKYEWERTAGSFCPTPRAVLIAKAPVDAGPTYKEQRGDGDSLSPLADVATPPARRKYQKRAGQTGGGRAVPLRSAVLRSTPPSDQEAMFSCAEGEEEEVMNSTAPAASLSARLSARPAGGVKGRKAAVAEASPPLLVEDEDGWTETLNPAGSTNACRLRVGLASDNWLCCDIIVPPSSFNDAETLNEGTSLLIHVYDGAQGGLTALHNGQAITLGSGDNLTILPGSEYSLRNDSQTARAHVKMVMVTP